MCHASFSDFITEEVDTIAVKAKLQPNAAYYWRITSRHGHKYGKAFNTDAQGYWSIAKADLPPGFLTNNIFELEVFKDLDDTNPQDLVILQHYKSINITTNRTSGFTKAFVGGNE